MADRTQPPKQPIATIAIAPNPKTTRQGTKQTSPQPGRKILKISKPTIPTTTRRHPRREQQQSGRRQRESGAGQPLLRKNPILELRQPRRGTEVPVRLAAPITAHAAIAVAAPAAPVAAPVAAPIVARRHRCCCCHHLHHH